jgi:hypothetical protein
MTPKNKNNGNSKLGTTSVQRNAEEASVRTGYKQ